MQFDLVVFVTALFIAAFSPGPSIISVVAITLSSGVRSAAWFACGVIMGDLVWLMGSVSGLAIVAQQFPEIFIAIKWGGVLYLMYLAYQSITADSIKMSENKSVDSQNRNNKNIIFSGLSVTLGNPKAILFYLALLPSLVVIDTVSLNTILLQSVTVILVLAVVFAIYISIAHKASQHISNTKSPRVLNYLTGSALAGAAVWIASK